MSAWVDFMTGFGYDKSNRHIETVLNYDCNELEDVHDYIQWLFPNFEPSRYNMKAPILTNWDVNYVKANKRRIKTNIKRALQMMLYFWGFTMYDFGVYVYIKHDGIRYPWMFPYDHNHQRVSRVIHFLRAVGMQKHATAFHSALERMYTKNPNYFSKDTIRYWQKIMD